MNIVPVRVDLDVVVECKLCSLLKVLLEKIGQCRFDARDDLVLFVSPFI